MTERVTDINVAFPEVEELALRVRVGACRLKIAKGAEDAWIKGVYRDPSGKIPLQLSEDGGVATITVGQSVKDVVGLIKGFLAFDLSMGVAKPYAMAIDTGASDNDLDLGGLPLTRLELKQGAGKLDMDISAQNPTEMTLLSLGTGASSVDARNLANANFAEMVVEGGAAACRLDFGGELKRDATVRVSTGVTAVEVSVPAATAAKIFADYPLGSIDVGDGFMKKEGAFWTEAALEGRTPVLKIRSSVALGSLKIRTT